MLRTRRCRRRSSTVKHDSMYVVTRLLQRQRGPPSTRSLPSPIVMPPTLEPPFAGSKAMLCLGGKWITANYKYHIYHARHAKFVRKYCLEQYGWTDREYDTVCWPAVKRCRGKKMSYRKFKQTSKMMHSWLPLGHMRHHVTGLNQCPGGTCNAKTIDQISLSPRAHEAEARGDCFSAPQERPQG